jgi:predicted lipid-binding transport protein (Tim44 family)
LTGAQQRRQPVFQETNGGSMKKILMGLMVAVMAVSIGLSTAEAKRMGGGGSVGKQSQSARQAPAQSTQAAAPAAAGRPAAATPPSSPWKGILGGALLGLGLGALFSSMGLSGAMASMLSTMLMVALFAVAAMFIYRLWKKRSGANAASGPRPAFGMPGVNSASEAAPAALNRQPEAGQQNTAAPMAFQSALASTGGQGMTQQSFQPYGVPADFDSAGFLRQSKSYFIRLQAAWDRADVNDIREFTTPEMFAEMRMQLQERGASANHTDVVSIDAELLGIETAADEYLASVRFSGQIKESEDAPVAPFTEIWNLSKPVQGNGGWTLAGIQQVS